MNFAFHLYKKVAISLDRNKRKMGSVVFQGKETWSKWLMSWNATQVWNLSDLKNQQKKKKEIDKKFLEWLVLARDGRRKRCICVVFPAVTPQQETPQGKRVFFFLPVCCLQFIVMCFLNNHLYWWKMSIPQHTNSTQSSFKLCLGAPFEKHQVIK